MAGLLVGNEAPVFDTVDHNGTRFSLKDFRGEKSVVLVFLRYIGCPMCRRYIAELANKKTEFDEGGAELVVVVQSREKEIRKYSPVKEPPFRIVPDPEAKLYALYGVERASPATMLKPEVALSAIKAMASGYMHAPLLGDELRTPGVFIIDKEGILRLSHTGSHIADIPEPRKVLDDLKG